MDYHAYIVRIRNETEGQPYGFVTDPRTGEKRPFHTAAELLALLLAWPLPPLPNPKEKNDAC